ncbi:DUF7696 family protein [Cupriavidus sp. CuC1]|uniref:DUF7696 family protein n=1 Tax=Cupriavidus sp. CuC1 TaxID=3373131 RepID=UPI0037D7427E
MRNHTARDAEIAAAIDATLLRRRQQFDGQPAAWHVLCEAAHVATLGEPARRAFVARVAASRGADIALRLLLKAQSIRATVTAALEAGEDVDAGQPARPPGGNAARLAGRCTEGAAYLLTCLQP